MLREEIPMLYSAFTVSNYMIAYTNSKDYFVTNLKLQKLLYFVQVYFLLDTGLPCFPDKVEACPFGPVIPEVYKHYITRGNYDLYAKDEGWMCEDVRKRVRDVVDLFSDYTNPDLADLIFNQTPYIEAEISDDKVITFESLLRYFKSDV